MNNLRTQSQSTEAASHTDQAIDSVSPTTVKAQRGRPPGRGRKENLAVATAAASANGTTEQTRPEYAEVQIDPLLTPRRVNGRVSRLGRSRPALGRANNDKPIFTLSVAAEILHLHPRTLRIYEEHDLVVPTRTQTNRRRYSQNDIKKFQFIQYLTRERGVNLSGVKIILTLLEELRKTVAEPIRQVFPDYGESEGFPLL